MSVRRVYVGPADLYYPDLQLTPTPGETYTLPGEVAERLTDSRWLTEGEAKKTRRRTPAAGDDPAAPDATEPSPDPSPDATSEAGEPAAAKE